MVALGGADRCELLDAGALLITGRFEKLGYSLKNKKRFLAVQRT